jgi:hypothetical protein
MLSFSKGFTLSGVSGVMGRFLYSSSVLASSSLRAASLRRGQSSPRRRLKTRPPAEQFMNNKPTTDTVLAKPAVCDFSWRVELLVKELELISDYDGQAHIFASRNLGDAFRKAGFADVNNVTIHKLLCEMFDPEWNPYRPRLTTSKTALFDETPVKTPDRPAGASHPLLAVAYSMGNKSPSGGNVESFGKRSERKQPWKRSDQKKAKAVPDRSKHLSERMNYDLKFHELADLFPLVSEPELQELADDLKRTNGPLEKIHALRGEDPRRAQPLPGQSACRCSPGAVALRPVQGQP